MQRENNEAKRDVQVEAIGTLLLRRPRTILALELGLLVLEPLSAV